MNEDFNPGKTPGNSPGDAGNGLASALEELIQGRLSGDGDSAPEPSEREKIGLEAATEACPAPGELALLLGDQPRSAEVAKVNALLAHAAGCEVCAERLRALSADLSPE